MMVGDVSVGHHDRASSRQVGRQQRAGPVDQAGADPHLVGARTEAHLHPPLRVAAQACASRSRWARRASSTASTLTKTLAAAVSTVTWASP